MALGEEKQACSVFKQIWDVEPNGPTSFALAKNATLPELQILDKALAKIVAKDEGSVEPTFHFAIAEIKHRTKNYSEAHTHLVRGNALQNQRCTFDIEDERRFCNGMKEVFSVDIESAPPPLGEHPVPIFIVGLPRSGSTLLSRIISAHRNVTSLGETGEFQNSVRRLETLNPSSQLDTLAYIQDSYLGSNAVTKVDTSYFFDKNLGNIFYVGHILHALPHAKVIHIHRDPRATAWSIYRQCFSRGQWPFAYDPKNIVEFHDVYRELMKFWATRFQNKILHLCYEDLIENADEGIPKLIEGLGLSWDAACLSPEKSLGMVATASKSQVRKSIYKGSNSAWRNYEQYAGEWLSKLPDNNWLDQRIIVEPTCPLKPQRLQSG